MTRPHTADSGTGPRDGSDSPAAPRSRPGPRDVDPIERALQERGPTVGAGARRRPDPGLHEPVPGEPFAQRQVALVDLLDRLLAGGAVIAGDLTLRIADVDLVRIDLRALISSVNERVPSPFTDVKPLDDPRTAQDPPRERPLDHPYDDATEEPPS